MNNLCREEIFSIARTGFQLNIQFFFSEPETFLDSTSLPLNSSTYKQLIILIITNASYNCLLLSMYQLLC